MKACRGVGASLSEGELVKWDREHRELLDRIAPEQFDVLHYAALAVLKKKTKWGWNMTFETERLVLRGKEAYAICLKEDGKAIDAIELKLNGHTDMTDKDDEGELGYYE